MFFQEVLCYLEELNIPYICASIFDNLFDDDSQNQKNKADRRSARSALFGKLEPA